MGDNKKKVIVLYLSSIIFSIADSQGYPWADYTQRSLAEVAKKDAIPQQKLLKSPQKVDVNASGNFSLSLPVMTVPGRGGLNFEIALN